MEKRKHKRYVVWFPVRLEDESAHKRLGVSHNASCSGILLVSNTHLGPGEPVVVQFRVSPEDLEERKLVGQVVRIEANSDDPHGLWPYRLAVEFEETAKELEILLQDSIEVPEV